MSALRFDGIDLHKCPCYEGCGYIIITSLPIWLPNSDSTE